MSKYAILEIAREAADNAINDVWDVTPGTFSADSRTAEYWRMVYESAAIALAKIDRIEKGIS